MLALCGISESQMPRLYESFAPVGTLLPETAAALGLPQGVTVCAGAGDNAAAGVGTINYGLFIQNIVNFILTAFCMFLVIRAMNKVYKKPEPAPEKPKRICPFCKSEIADDATRCPHCTSMLE